MKDEITINLKYLTAEEIEDLRQILDEAANRNEAEEIDRAIDIIDEFSND